MTEDPREDRSSGWSTNTTAAVVVEPIDHRHTNGDEWLARSSIGPPPVEPPAGIPPAGIPPADTSQEAGSEPGGPPGGSPVGNPSPKGLDQVRRGIVEIRTGTRALVVDRVSSVRLPLGRRRVRLTKRIFLVGLMVVAMVVAAIAVGAASLLSRPPGVVVSVAVPATIDSEPGGVGNVIAVPSQTFSVGLDLVGVTEPVAVTQVDVVSGTEVAAGTPLLELNPTPLNTDTGQISIELRQDQAALAAAEAAQASTTPTSPYLAVEIPNLQGQVALDQQLLSIAMGNAPVITAPISGYVVSVAVQPGQIVQPGLTMVQIVNPSQIDVTAGFQLDDMQAISPGDTADITPTELPGVHLTGTVVSVSPQASAGGLQGTVILQANNLVNHPVPIGAEVFVHVHAPHRVAVSVPIVAVVNSELAPAVFVVKGGHISLHTVTVGVSDDQRTQVVSGSEPGETVAISNMQSLRNGASVRILSVQR